MIETQGKEFAEGMKQLEDLKERLLSVNVNTNSRIIADNLISSVSQQAPTPASNLSTNPTNHIEDYTEVFLFLMMQQALKMPLKMEVIQW